MNVPVLIFENLISDIFGLKILTGTFLDADPDSGSCQPWIRDKHPGFATLLWTIECRAIQRIFLTSSKLCCYRTGPVIRLRFCHSKYLPSRKILNGPFQFTCSVPKMKICRHRTACTPWAPFPLSVGTHRWKTEAVSASGRSRFYRCHHRPTCTSWTPSPLPVGTHRWKTEAVSVSGRSRRF